MPVNIQFSKNQPRLGATTPQPGTTGYECWVLRAEPAPNTEYPSPPTESEENLVGLGRLELPTSPLSGVRSSHLSYRPENLTEGKMQLIQNTGTCSHLGWLFLFSENNWREFSAILR